MKMVKITLIGESQKHLQDGIEQFKALNITKVSDLIYALKKTSNSIFVSETSAKQATVTTAKYGY